MEKMQKDFWKHVRIEMGYTKTILSEGVLAKQPIQVLQTPESAEVSNLSKACIVW